MKQYHWAPLTIALVGAACTAGVDRSGKTASSDQADASCDGGVDASGVDSGAGDAAGEASASSAAVVQSLVETPIVTNQTDANLVNAWGLAFNPNGLAWVADNGTGLSTVYKASGPPAALTVTIPTPPGASGPSAPTGTVFNVNAADFLGDKFVFATEDGTIAGWQAGDHAVLRADNSQSGAVYKGVAIVNHTELHDARVYAANFFAGTVDVWDTNFRPVSTSGGFQDSNVPTGFAPFNVVLFDRSFLLVSYAMQDDMKHDDVAGPGNGFVDMFDLDGKLLTRLISRGVLNSPWGMTFTPRGWGMLGNTLLVGNFGDGRINAFQLTGLAGLLSGDPSGVHAVLLGTMGDATGKPLSIDGLWSLKFGVENGGFDEDTLYFTAGPMKETQGIFGMLALP